ncbi:hypothetical protein JTB14_021426 [Gonioctena quinquepunctata]|nr:hypothetical protein JTB14_021426 [Gonioctena quinquepunctata]
MNVITIVAFLCSITDIWCYDINNNKFPDDFMFGVATAAYQIEGAWNEDGKSENIWDRVVHRVPSPIDNNDTGDIACDAYHKYKEDVALLKDLGVDVYRFSLSWSRILPNGFDNKINEEGVTYYKNFIKELLANNIKPLVTMYHWDLPQILQDAGGWESEFIVDTFVDYARVCFQEFGDDVGYWITFNEPQQVCSAGYGYAQKAPLISSPGIGEYSCSYNLLRAHSKVWHLYNEEFRRNQKGFIGITLNSNWFEPNSNSTEDLEASETSLQFSYGWFAHPVVHGDWPKIMKNKIAARSEKQGYRKSRLPNFTKEEVEYMKGTVDFLGLNTYSSSMAKAIAEPDMTGIGSWVDPEVDTWQPTEWEGSASAWLKVGD